MINVTYYLAFLMVIFRLSSFLMAVPIFFPSGTPRTVKIGASAMITFLILPSIPYDSISNIQSNMDLIVFCINEIITGLALGYITKACFSVAQMAGQIMDLHVGFAMMHLFDPMSEENVTLLGQLLYWIALIVFFLIDGHHMLIRALVESFQVIDIGKFVLSQQSAYVMINSLITFFTIGLKIAIPIVLIILITDLSLGLVARTVPQLNVMILGMPIKILVGLSCFALALPILMKMLVQVFEQLPDMIKNFYHVIPFVVFAAGDSGEKTEEATPKKKSDAKKKGQVAKSKELSSTFTLLAVTLVMVALGGYLFTSLKETFLLFFNEYLTIGVNESTVKGIFIVSAMRIAMIFFPVVLPIMVMGVLANFAQSGFILTGEPLKPDLKKLNPISGFKKIFSMRSLVDLIKNLAVVTVIGIMGYQFVAKNYRTLMNAGQLKTGAILSIWGGLVVEIFFKITLVMLIISIADYVYQRYQHNKDLKMSKQEVKEEFKQQEGDPQIKGKIRQKQKEMAMRRMMQQVPDATVVITNPTHIAIALKYEEGKDKAPTVLAKGADHVAIKIKEIAKENGVPIIENKPLARLIFAKVELEQQIPVDMYQAVAEILALVYKLKKRK